MLLNSKLEPEYKQPNRCPKCGMEARVSQRQCSGHYFVYCQDERCKFAVVTKNYDTWNEAVDAWNAGEYTITPIREK